MTATEFFHKNPDAPHPNRPIGVGVLALIEPGEKLLLERRSDCGRWGLVGGAVEVGEALDSALRREVLEETGLTIESHTLFCISADPSRIVRYPDGNTVQLLSFVYKVKVESFEDLRPSEESEELHFFGFEELPALDIVETAQPIVLRFLEERRAGNSTEGLQRVLLD